MRNLKTLSVLLTAILLLIACEKENTSIDKEYFSVNHWPEVKTLEATPITISSARLTGSVNANGLATTVTFEYGTTTSYGSTVTANQSPVTGDGTYYVTADISGLIPDTTYHIRVKAENSLWKNFYGRDVEFIIHPPEVETLEVTKITGISPTLNGTVNTYGLSTTVTFEYGTTTSYGNTVVYPRVVAENSITNVSAIISGLTPCTTYHFRVKAENPLGIVYGSDFEFIFDNPMATTLEATNAENTSTILNGTANGLSVTVTFEYGTTPSYGSTITADQSPVTGNSITNVSAIISGLTPCMTYHFRVKAEYPCGIVYGSDKTFILPTWTTYPIGYVNGIAIDPQGNLWFGTYLYVSKFDGTNWTFYPSNDTRAIAIDAESNIWLASRDISDMFTGRGVSKFDGTNWTTYTKENSGLASNDVSAIAIDAQGNKWFGTSEGVSKFDGTNWTTYSIHGVNAIAIDAQGNKWFGGYEGVSKFDGTKWTNYNTNSGFASNTVNAIAIDAQGNKWFGFGDYWNTIGGVSKFDGTTWTTYSTANNSVTAIAIDAQGNKWFGTMGGVLKFDDTNWTTYTSENSGLVENDVHSIAIDAQGNKWFGTHMEGVSKLSETCNE